MGVPRLFAAPPASAAGAYRYLNAQRTAAGMVPLTPEPRLAQAAAAHAAYLARHGLHGHGQRRGRRGYTGGDPVARAIRAGYPHRAVSENLSTGNPDATEAIDGLMGAIYHRLGFLAFDRDEVGAGIVGQAGRERFVFVLGRADLRALCAAPPPEALFRPPGAYLQPCAQGPRIGKGYADALERALLERNPRHVVWPPPDATGIPPAFYEEDPDPLPDLAVSGYPVSVQFNPAHVRRATLRGFALYRLDARGRTRLRGTRRFTATSDPNRLLTPLQFALFPLQRLDWDTAYEVEAQFLLDGQAESLRWRFRTRDAGAPLYVVQGRGEVLPVVAGRDYALYLPPGRSRAFVTPFRYEHPPRVQAAVQALDRNTLRVRVEGAPCGRADFRLPGGGVFSLRLAARDNVDAEHPPQVLYAHCPEFSADHRIKGRDELLTVDAGRTVRVHVRPQAGAGGLGRVRWQHPAGTAVQVEFEDAHTLRLRVDGPPCALVRVSLAGGRGFRVRVAGAAGCGS